MGKVTRKHLRFGAGAIVLVALLVVAVLGLQKTFAATLTDLAATPDTLTAGAQVDREVSFTSVNGVPANGSLYVDFETGTLSCDSNSANCVGNEDVDVIINGVQRSL